MDDIVRQAMAKWPNVPHCYGWLALDARGAWRMRDAHAQAMGLPGDRIVHAALLGFINRNYAGDEQGRWYFQNGPQRVYVNLELTPYIARTDPAQGFVLHTGEPLPTLDDAWLTDGGRLILEGAGKVAALDDRDLAQCLSNLRIGGLPVSDEQWMAWPSQPSGSDGLMLHHAGRQVPVQHLADHAMTAHFGFVQIPQSEQ